MGVILLAVAFELVAAQSDDLTPTGHEFEPDEELHKWLQDRLNCVWPHCLPKCDPCPHAGSRVGMCYASYVSSAFACDKRKPDSDCFLGSCLCNPGYCATPNGFNNFDCVKIPCVDEGTGPSPPAYEPNWYDRLWVAWTPKNTDFPSPEQMQTHWKEYVASIMFLPLVLLLIGVTVAAIVACVLCCGCTGHHFIYGRGNRHLTKGSTRVPTKPSSRCLIVLGVLIIVIVTFATVKRYQENRASVRLASATMGLVHSDSTIVATQAQRINATVEHFFEEVGKFVHDCEQGKSSWVKPILEGANISGIIEHDLSHYKEMVNNYSNKAQTIPLHVKKARDFAVGNEETLSFLPNVPLILLGFTCLAILGEAYITVRIGSSSCAQCVETGLRVATIVFVMIILLVAISITVSSTIAITASHFCIHPDKNTMAYSSLANSTMVGNATRFYVMGDTLNPIFTMSQVARKYLLGLNGVFLRFKPLVNFAQSLCTTSRQLNLTALAVEAIDVLENADRILQAQKLWPYYQLVVRRGVCKDLTRNLSQMVVLQFIIGLILFPTCAIATHSFLVKWSAWEQYWKTQDDNGVAELDDELTGLTYTDNEEEWEYDEDE